MQDTKYAANREFDVLTTGALGDAALVESVNEWLKTSCGFKVAPKGNDKSIITEARYFVFILSHEALSSSKLIGLIDSALRETYEHIGLRFITLIRNDVSDEELPEIITEHGFIRVKGNSLNANEAVAVLEAIHPLPPGLCIGGRPVKDVYLSRTWLKDATESEPADQVCTHASKFGFRLIGDTEDPDFDTDVRLPIIMAGCGGFIAVLPYRSGTCGTSEWMLEELRLANIANLPCLIVKDARVSLPEELSSKPNVVELLDYSTNLDWSIRLDRSLKLLDDHYRQPANPADVLYLSDGDERIDTVKALVSRITGMELTTFNRSPPDCRVLLELVHDADIVLCDLPRRDVVGWITVGCAVALNRKIEILMSEFESSSLSLFPFMHLRKYTSELDWLGQLYRVLRRHRRKVLNYDRS
jgi:hypothetical protein